MSYLIYDAGKLRELAAVGLEAKLYRAPSGRFWTNLVVREADTPRVAEVHDAEADIYLVVEGEAVLYLGGSLVKPTSPAPGQHRGTTLHGCKPHRLAPGDLIIIPEGVAHMVENPGHFVYLVIKEHVGE